MDHGRPGAPLIPIHHIGLVNRSRGLVADALLAVIVEAYRAEIPTFCAAWGLPEFGLALYDPGHRQVPAEEGVLFVVDSANDPDTFGAHTQIGAAAFGYIDAGLCAARGEPISRVIGHEMWELPVDPGLDRWADVGGGELVAVECADPVQRVSDRRMASLFGQAAVVEIADYCYPSFYQPGGVPPFDRFGAISSPLTMAPGGYMTRKQAGVTVVEGEARVTSIGRTFRRMAGAARVG